MADSSTAVESKEFALEIVTPQRSIFSSPVKSFTAPGTMGSFQVLYDHAPLLATIGIGQMKLVNQDDSEVIYATSGGYVQVSNNHVVFLADSVERKDEIDIARATAAEPRAAERINRKEPGTDMDRARAALARALNRLKVAEAS